ncbi:PAP2 superfamily protein [Pontibacter ummariensis]|uniref:PAP2 superfamily protein n=1 Tax=Pontibacter ummariensis TaxID=1610492 RepID=A0A239H9S6_9BACT|nr:phosphatase PAP2 family protein [Pontibacter ummariensis]PRY10689.1 PAP2 superfamily protein [Pontibacter ummariensis]SNS78107.1 PAP2 superfamily protein [Pontibacter ummariensis]
MRHFLFITTLFTFLSGQAFSQADSPYATSFKVDAPIIAAGVGLSYYGLTLIADKSGLTEEQINSLNRRDVNRFDRFSAGYDSESARKVSDFPFYGSFGLPVLLLLNDNVGSKAGQVMLLYVETMAVTGTIFTLTNGNVERTRPLVYSEDVDISEKNDGNARNSFFAGHTAATASATFFAAKVFHDFNPDSKARPYIWAAAAAIPATVGYLRLRAGKHFLSDNLIGYAVGAAAGILVPQLHKKTNKTNLSLIPVSGRYFNGALLTYSF